MASSEDWRVEIDIEDPGHTSRLHEGLAAHELSDEAKRELGSGVSISNDGDKLFVYTASLDTARAAERVVADVATQHEIALRTSITTWHDAAEAWEPADAPDVESAEHQRLIETEREEVAEQGYPDWEVRVQCHSHSAARALSDRLTEEGVPHVRHWKYLVVGATDEDAAKTWADRLKGEAGPSAEVEVEGTFVSVSRHNPWRTYAELSGNP
jgi:hypothetical protein